MRTARLINLLLLPVALVLLGLTVWWAAVDQRSAVETAADRNAAAARVLIGHLDSETGLRGFLLNGRESFLEPYRDGRRQAVQAARQVGQLADGDAQVTALLNEQRQLADRWHRGAVRQIERKRRDPGYGGDPAEALERKDLMDRIRSVNAALTTRLDRLRDDELRAAGLQMTVVLVLLTLAIGGGSVLARSREGRRRTARAAEAAAFRAGQREFSEVIQSVDSEAAAHALLKRHLELRLDDTAVTVLDHDPAEGTLTPATPVPDGSVLEGRIETATARSCLAVRLGRPHTDIGSGDQLATCELCGHDGPTNCQPLLVGGQVIGTVLAEGKAVCDDDDGERRISESVALAAPVLANLRTISKAERRASTDPLTGLPNRRAFDDTIARMCAQALRSRQSLAAISLDLDRFKDINDRFGHDMGDAVLAVTANLLTRTVRASDFCARLGGEEFVVLAPDTDLEGAKTLAENLRAAFAAEPVNGLDRPITASLGIAMLPDHAEDPATLLRLSDRALYAAKSRGRNRAEVVDVLSGSADRDDTATAG